MKFTKNNVGWMFYDFANSAFTTVIVSVVYNTFFISHVVGNAEGRGDSLWGLAVGLSMTLVALTAPFFGAMADYSRIKKRFLFFFTYLTVVSTSMLWFVRQGDILLGMVLFIVANYSFNSANVFYDAFLPEVAEPKDIGKVSGFGWGLGYLGGLVSLLVSFALVKNHIQWVFPMIGLHVLLFSLITFFLLKEQRTKVARQNYLKIAIGRIATTVGHIKTMPNLLKYLLSYFFYNDGIYTVIVFAAPFGSNRFSMSQQDIITFFIIAQFTSLLGAVVFGWLTDRVNVKTSLSISLMVWLGVIVWAFFCSSSTEYYFVGLAAGLAIGSSQANSRTMMSQLTPISKQAEFFGFYTLIGRLSSIAGPILYGWIAQATGNLRLSILSLLIFFVVGWVILQLVNLPQGMAQASLSTGGKPS